MRVGLLADIHSGYRELARQYFIHKYAKLSDVIIVLGDIVGAHADDDVRDAQDPGDFIKAINFLRVREAKELPAPSGPSQECIDHIVQKHAKDDPQPKDIDALIESEYVFAQAELSAPIIEEARYAPINVSHKRAEPDHIPMMYILGNIDRLFMEYVLTGERPKESLTINSKAIDALGEQVKYAFAGYDSKLFVPLMDEIIKKGNLMSDKKIGERISEIITKHGGAAPEGIGQRADYQRLMETLPAMAWLKKQYDKQKEPENQCMIVKGSKINMLVTHSCPPGSDRYVGHRNDYTSPVQIAKEFRQYKGVRIDVIAYAHTHVYDETVVLVVDPETKTCRKMAVINAGSCSEQREGSEFKTATSLNVYTHRKAENCTMLIEGPI